MKMKSWFLLTLAALALNTGSVFGGEDDETEGKEVSSTEEAPKNDEPVSSGCGCSG